MQERWGKGAVRGSSGSWNPQQLRPRLPLLIPHRASLNQPQRSSYHGAWCLQPSPRQQSHGDAAPVSTLTQWSRNHPLGPRTTSVASSLQNTRMPLPRRGRLCCQLWEKTARVAIYTLNCKLGKNSTSSFWSSFKPRCRKRLFLEEKIFLPTHRSENGHLPGGEEERQPHTKVKYTHFSTSPAQDVHQEPD